MARIKCTEVAAFLVSAAVSHPGKQESQAGGPKFVETLHFHFTNKDRFVRQSKTMASQRKPVIVRKFSRDWCAGYAGTGLGQDAAELEILDLDGKVQRLPWEQVKWVCYVRDFPVGDAANPERLLRKRFAIRPRTPGLWLRMTLTDGEELEGLAGNDRSLIEGAGLLLTPPDTRSNTQRIYVPRQAIQSLEVLSLIGAPGRRRSASRQTAEQPELFPPEPERV
jgi:hypothetical protein